MSYSSPLEIQFSTLAEVKAFAKWYLGTSVTDSADDEFSSEAERDEHYERRSSRLAIQIDELRNVKFESATPTTYTKQKMYKLCKAVHKPLDSVGSDLRTSRFNYKDNPLFKNRVLYFGQDKDCCYSEIFHSDFMTLCYPQFETKREGELPRAKYNLYEYNISLNKILVLTSSSTFKSLGISQGVLKDEWLELNSTYNIPSSSQILGAMAKAKGFQGILYGSVRHQLKNNLVIFEENIKDMSLIAEHVSLAEFDLEKYELANFPKK